MVSAALALPASERAELAQELIRSLDGPRDPGAEAAWFAEAERRLDAVESGVVESEPWDPVAARLAAGASR